MMVMMIAMIDDDDYDVMINDENLMLILMML